MPIFSRLVTIALLTAVGGCSSLPSMPSLSSLNPFSSKSVPRNPPVALVDVKPILAVRSLWSGSVGTAGIYTFSPAVTADSVFAGAQDGTLARFEMTSGKPVWRISIGGIMTAGVGSDGNTVAVAGEKGAVMAFDDAGKLRWKAQMSSEVLSAPAVGQGLVIVRSQDNRIVGFDAATGARKWTVQRTAPALTLRAAPGILIAGPSAFVALPGGKLLAITLATGAPRWEAAVGEARGTTELERIIDTSGMPVAAGREVCAVSYQGRAMCFDGASGTVAWAKDLSSDVGLGADERFIFASDFAGAVQALTRDAGASVWKNTQLAYRRLSAPVSIGRAVAVGDYQGYVHFLGREDGAMLARIATDGSEILAAPVLAGGNLIIQTRAGAVVALAAE
ncbi:MAG: outer membrane protein assembly factor BamB [Herminiimonas sp.]|nr:outer membrane protein assembly factor BamB [Herminiimonas sp.]